MPGRNQMSRLNDQQSLGAFSKNINAIFVIAYRDFTKLVRDRPRMLISLVFPLIFIGALGGTFQASLGSKVGFNLLEFVFTGVFAQTLFQSTASGIISLIEDRENDFSQEIFVSPISRYTIITGKIVGETIVSFAQIIGVLAFALLVGIHLTIPAVLGLLATGFVASLLGGAFGVLVLANLSNQRSANQIFPFLIFPQFFLSGIFTPLVNLPLPLFILSRIAPMTYAVDLIRGVYYWDRPEYKEVVIYNPGVNLAIIAALFLGMMTIGTLMFVRNERNR